MWEPYKGSLDILPEGQVTQVTEVKKNQARSQAGAMGAIRFAPCVLRVQELAIVVALPCGPYCI